jgi:hypothetical protein
MAMNLGGQAYFGSAWSSVLITPEYAWTGRPETIRKKHIGYTSGGLRAKPAKLVNHDSNVVHKILVLPKYDNITRQWIYYCFKQITCNEIRYAHLEFVSFLRKQLLEYMSNKSRAVKAIKSFATPPVLFSFDKFKHEISSKSDAFTSYFRIRHPGNPIAAKAQTLRAFDTHRLITTRLD